MKRLLGRPRASVSSIRACPWACKVNTNSYWSDQAGLLPRGQDQPGQLAAATQTGGATIDLVCLGYDHFIKWWHYDHLSPTSRKSLAFLPISNKAAGYFIHNVVEAVSPYSVEDNQEVWFPREGKELHRDDEERRN